MHSYGNMIRFLTKRQSNADQLIKAIRDTKRNNYRYSNGNNPCQVALLYLISFL